MESRQTTRRNYLFPCAVMLMLGLGCDAPVRFTPAELASLEHDASDAAEVEAAGVMRELFGTPDQPRVPDALARVLDIESLRHAAGPVASHTPGETIGLYRRHCATCHGITGDGAGPAALYQTPYPRDFRRGVFKYKSTYREAMPTDDDLAATLRHGIKATAMPSFALLPEHEIDSLIAYTKYLAIRGQAEDRLIAKLASEAPSPAEEADADEDAAENASETTGWMNEEVLPELADQWQQAGSLVVPANPSTLPSDSGSLAQWAAEGKELFHDTGRANCVKCHGESGQGGLLLEDYDIWEKRRHDFITATDRFAAETETLRAQLASAEAGAQSFLEQQIDARDHELEQRRDAEDALLPPRRSIARRLEPGALRSVRSPEDLFRRIQQGIAGTAMPAVGPTTPDVRGALSDEEVWKLAAYVMQLTDFTPSDTRDSQP